MQEEQEDKMTWDDCRSALFDYSKQCCIKEIESGRKVPIDTLKRYGLENYQLKKIKPKE